MVPPSSLRVPRARRYSGYSQPLPGFAYGTITRSGGLSHTLRLPFCVPYAVLTPVLFLIPVWPLPISLATTFGISFDFFSSPYLDVSVREVPHVKLCIHLTLHNVWVSPFGYPRVTAYFQLTVAFRRLSRPSSALSAKAFTLRSFSLELPPALSVS